MTIKLDLVFLNAKGLASPSRRRKKLEALQSTMVAFKLPFVFLSECHLTDSAWQEVNQLNPGWEGKRLASESAASSSEFAVFWRNNEKHEKLHVEQFVGMPTPKGAVALKVRHGELSFNVMLVHAPNVASMKRAFFKKLERILENTQEEAPFVILGDFNCVEYGFDRSPQRTAEPGKEELTNLVTSANCADAWLLLRNSDSVSFTYHQSTPAAKSRIDRIYIPELWSGWVEKWDTIPFHHSDHHIIRLSLKIHEKVGQARPWRLNPRILQKDFVEEILEKVPDTTSKAALKKDWTLADWLLIKDELRNLCMGKQRKRGAKLNSKIKSLYTKYTRLASKGRPTEAVCEEMAEAVDSYGSQVRTANFKRWREKGNKGNPYTLKKVKPRGTPTILKALRRTQADTPSPDLGKYTKEFSTLR